MALLTAFELLLLAAHTLASPSGYGHSPSYGGNSWGNNPRPDQSSSSSSWDLKKFTTLVAFGDSYTDDSRLNYFSENNGSAPPVGWVNPGVKQLYIHTN